MLQVWGDICVRSDFRVLTRVYVCIRICDLDGLLLRCCAVIETIPLQTYENLSSDDVLDANDDGTDALDLECGTFVGTGRNTD